MPSLTSEVSNYFFKQADDYKKTGADSNKCCCGMMTYLFGVRFIGLFYCGMLILSGLKAIVIAKLLSSEA